MCGGRLGIKTPAATHKKVPAEYQAGDFNCLMNDCAYSHKGRTDGTKDRCAATDATHAGDYLPVSQSHGDKRRERRGGFGSHIAALDGRAWLSGRATRGVTGST